MESPCVMIKTKLKKVFVKKNPGFFQWCRLFCRTFCSLERNALIAIVNQIFKLINSFEFRKKRK